MQRRCFVVVKTLTILEVRTILELLSFWQIEDFFANGKLTVHFLLG